MTDGPYMRAESLEGLRILVVEDEMLVAILLEEMLVELGCTVIGPAGRVPKALALAREEAVDLAILDINVAGEEVYPVADALSSRAIPFVFATGYGAPGLNVAYAGNPTLQKPFLQADLVRILVETAAARPGV